MDTQRKSNNSVLIPIGCCVLLTLSSCQTSSLDDLGFGAPQSLTVPISAPSTSAQTGSETEVPLAAQTTDVPAIADEQATAANKTGTFPQIGYVPVGETKQLTNSDVNKIRQQMLAAGKKNSQGGTGENLTEYQKELKLMREKAKNHGKDAIKKIESPSG